MSDGSGPGTLAIDLAERGWLPEGVLRWAIRRLCAARLADERGKASGLTAEATARQFIGQLEAAAIASVPERANDQHYMVPARLFELMLGPRLKYSCGFWEPGTTALAAAEEASLALSAEHARLDDGMDVLELGCGWGSFTLWMAEHFPRSRIVAMSNSASQRRHIEEQCSRRHLGNVEVITADINAFSTDRRFDRVVSIEMFEHVRNHRALLGRIAGWLQPEGALFVHVFRHRDLVYLYEDRGASDWMARHFFSGGVMPSAALLPSVPGPLALESQWDWNGQHYARTARAWLANLDARRSEVLHVLAGAYGAEHAARWFNRWRMFVMACEELFAFNGGREWGVSHYLFTRSRAGE